MMAPVYLSGTVGKVLRHLCNDKKRLELIFLGEQDDFLEQLAKGHDFDTVSPVIGHLIDIKFVPTWNALVPILYGADLDEEEEDEEEESLTSGGRRQLVVWGLLSQLQQDDSLDAATLTRRLSILHGARADAGLSDNVDLATNVARSSADSRIALGDVLSRWFDVVTVQ
jgi:hypothetical protein